MLSCCFSLNFQLICIGFQIASFDESEKITNALELNGEIIVIMPNGKFGQIKLGGNGGCSFVLLSKSKNESVHMRPHYLHEN